MDLDAIIISETGRDGLTGIVPERLQLDGNPCSVQAVVNYLENRGKIVHPVRGDGKASWWSAPKLNGVALLSHLMKRGFNTALVNKYYPEKKRFAELLKQNPRAVIVSTTFIRSRDAFQGLIEDIRTLAPDAFIIAGGPFVYYSCLVLQRAQEEGYLTEGVRDDFLFFNSEGPSADLYIVSLLGEEVLCRALERLRSNRPLDDLPNTARREGDRTVFSERVDDISQAGKTPIHWQDLPDSIFDSGVMPVQASKGCPHRCAFCNFVKDRRMLFAKPVDQVVEEIKKVSDRGIRYVWFVDDNFRLGSRDLEDVCRRFIRERLPVRWMTMVRAGTLRTVDPEILRESGCIEVQLGLESADPKILENMNKQANPDMYGEVVHDIMKAGINCSCYFLFGFPGETDETALRTRNFIRSLEHPELEGTLCWSLFPFSLYPLSPVYEMDQREAYGLTGYLRGWNHRTMDSGRAGEHVREAFLELDNSCPVYRGDNLDILFSLPARQRKRFLVERHRLSKRTLKNGFSRKETLEGFTKALGQD